MCLRSAQGSTRAALFAGTALLVLACGEKFTGIAEPSAGSGGMPSSAGSATVGGNMDGGVDGGGNDVGGRGGTAGKGGKGGAPASGGTGSSTGGVVATAGGGSGGLSAGRGGGGGSGGSGGAVVVEPPPVPLDGLELWLSADQGVTQSASVVSAWQDRSSKHRDALQTATNYRPHLVADALAGKPALVFDGSDDFLKLPTFDVDFTGGLSIFVVAQQPSVGTCQGYFEASNGSEIDDIDFGYWRGSLLFEVEENTVNDTNYPALLDTPQVAVVIQDAQGMTQVRSNTSGVGSGFVNLPPEASRAQVFLGKSLYADCVPFAGAMGEVLVYSRPVSDQELLQIEGYLQGKWMCCAQ